MTREQRIAITVKTTEGGRWIIPQIRAARDRGIHVIVLLPEGTGRLASLVMDMSREDDGLEVMRGPVAFKPGPRLFGDLVRLRRQIRALEVDAILYHLYATALMIRLATIGSGLRRVHMVAGPLYLESPIIRMVERILARLDSVIICGSRFTFDRYRELGVASRKLRVIPYGVDIDQFAPADPMQRRNARELFGFDETDFVVVMVAYVYAPKKLVYKGRGIKGHEDLLPAWSKFASRHENVRLLLVGGGFDQAGERHRQVLAASIPERNRAGSITWLDSVEDVRAAYSAADVSVSPSLSDNHGAALEASASGVPCIVSDAGALPETIPPGGGWIHQAGSEDSLLRSLEDAYAEFEDGHLASFAVRARDLMETDFSQARSAEMAIDVVIGKNPGPQNDQEAAGARPITMFSEVRLAGSPESAYSTDASLAEDRWKRALQGHDDVELAARMDGSGERSGHQLVGRIVALPYYQGIAGMIRKLPALMRAVDRAASDSSAVCVKLPGVIGLIAVRSAQRHGVPIAAEVVGDVEDVLRSGVAGSVGRLAAGPAGLLTRWAVRKADATRYVTRSTLQRRYPSRADAETVAYTDVVVEDDRHVRDESAVDPGLIVAVGSQEQLYKGHDVLIRALGLLGEQFPHAHVDLIGDGRRQEELRRLAAQLGLSARVHFSGYLTSRDELNQKLDSAEVFALPSRTEGLPRALVEAMARGVPCVASKVGGVPELLSDDMLCPPSDAVALAGVLADLLRDRALRTEQSERNLQRASEYSQANMKLARDHWRNAVIGIAHKSPDN